MTSVFEHEAQFFVGCDERPLTAGGYPAQDWTVVRGHIPRGQDCRGPR